jgi:hypothetical protein
MLHYFLAFLWNSIWMQVGLTGLVLAAAAAVFIYVPIPAVRHLAFATGVVCAVLLFLAPKLYVQGVKHERARVVAAEKRAVEMGDHARADALRDVSGGVRDDFDSDSQ